MEDEYTRPRPPSKYLIANVTPSRVRLYVGVANSTFVARATARWSNGQLFYGRVKVTTPLLQVQREYIGMSTITLSRDLTPADVGSGVWPVEFVTADGTLTTTLNITYTITAVEGAPIVTPDTATVSLKDNATMGTDVWTGTVTNFDGSAFNGTVNVGTAPLTFTE